MREHDIKSFAKFRIRLSILDEDPCNLLLGMIASKVYSGEILSNSDLYALDVLPFICKSSERSFYVNKCNSLKSHI